MGAAMVRHAESRSGYEHVLGGVVLKELSFVIAKVTSTCGVWSPCRDDRVRLSQHIVLKGPGAEAYVSVMEEHFAPNVGKGMERIAEEIARYAASR